jgi:hypothetical protein
MAVPVRSHLDIHHHWLSSRPGPLRLTAARTLGVAGLIAYNWWVAAPFQPGWLRSSNALFSDLAASDQPHALTLQHLDLTAGLLLVSALLLRGPIGRSGSRPEWKWLVAFAAMASAGGAFPLHLRIRPRPRMPVARTTDATPTDPLHAHARRDR